MNKSGLYFDVPWETRNLGVPSFEFHSSRDAAVLLDGLAEIKLKHHQAFFAQLRVLANDIAAIRAAEDAGFRFAEMAIDPCVQINASSLFRDFSANRNAFVPSGFMPELFVRECVLVGSLRESDKRDILKITEEAYSADRFHMDDRVPQNIADQRMILWVREDLFSFGSGVSCSMLRYDGQLVGYILWKNDRFILGAAIAAAFMGKGLAKYVYLSAMEDVLAAGFPTMSTSISINNLIVLNLYSRLGFSFAEPTVVMHYWGGEVVSK